MINLPKAPRISCYDGILLVTSKFICIEIFHHSIFVNTFTGIIIIIIIIMAKNLDNE